MNTKTRHLCHLSIPTTVAGLLYTRALLRVGAHTRARVGMSLAALVVLVSLLFSPLAVAATQGYNSSDKTITKGMAVAISSSQDGTSNGIIYVEKSSVNHADKTLGVVVDPTTDIVAVSASGNQLYVATSGGATVYVTDLNGSIHRGDLLAASPLAGILMRVVQGSKGVVGVAQSDFPTKGAQTVSIDDGTKVKIATVQINMDVKFTTNNANTGKTLLQRFGEAVVHHEVSTAQALVALIILTLLIVVEGGIIYAAISSAMVSLGRNPLARGTIMKGLGQVTGLVAFVLALGIASVYLVLWI